MTRTLEAETRSCQAWPPTRWKHFCLRPAISCNVLFQQFNWFRGVIIPIAPLFLKRIVHTSVGQDTRRV